MNMEENEQATSVRVQLNGVFFSNIYPTKEMINESNWRDFYIFFEIFSDVFF